MKQQTIVTLDLEGVLVPEIWIAFAEKTGIEKLKLTTRDIPDYDELMAGRLAILAENGLKLADIQEVIGTLAPLEGARAFLDELRTITQVVILSDTFEEFAGPLMRQLAWPAILCHQLEIERRRACGQLPVAAAGSEMQRRGGVSRAELQSDRRRRLVQRYDHAGRGRCWLSLSGTGRREGGIPAVYLG